MSCTIEGCDRRAETRLGYCLMHYKRWKRHGDALVITVKPRTGKCAVTTCDREDFARGYCRRHVQRLYQGKPMEELPSLFERLGQFNISERGCWEWQGTLAGNGTHKYGQIRVFGQPMQVHRVMYELCVGHVGSNCVVCHRCDNPKCINPEHLFLGTAQDNSDDMKAKGRHVGPLPGARAAELAK